MRDLDPAQTIALFDPATVLRARHLWELLPIDRALRGLADHGLTVEGLKT